MPWVACLQYIDQLCTPGSLKTRLFMVIIKKKKKIEDTIRSILLTIGDLRALG